MVVIGEYITNPEIEVYYRHVIEVINALSDLLSLGSDGHWVIFGGFIRDIIAGIDIDTLRQKDVDIYLIHDNHVPSMYDYANKAIDIIIRTKEIEVIKYNPERPC